QVSFRGATYPAVIPVPQGTPPISLPLDAQTTTAAQLQLALAAIPTIGTGNVTVTGPAGGPYVVTFASVLGNTDVDPLVVTTVDGVVDFEVTETLKGSPNAPGVLVNEIQRLTN